MRRTVHLSLVLPCIALAATLPGCARKATGQVAAVVNGDEITLQEVNAELGPVPMADAAQKGKIRAAVVQSLIDKRLLEQEAKAAGLDRDPDYLIRKRQLDQALLLEFYAKRAQDTLRIPDQATIARFVADHPMRFAGRTIFTVGQLRFPPPGDAGVVDGLRDLHSLNAITAYLVTKGIKVERTTGKIDSAQVPPALMTQIAATPAGEPFIVPTPQGVVAGVIVDRTPAPLPDAQTQPLAAQMIRSQTLESVVQQRLKEARSKAKISYQPGFSPVGAQTTGTTG